MNSVDYYLSESARLQSRYEPKPPRIPAPPKMVEIEMTAEQMEIIERLLPLHRPVKFGIVGQVYVRPSFQENRGVFKLFADDQFEQIRTAARATPKG